VIGKAICDGQLLDAHFTRSFYKHMLGLPVSVGDLEAIEPDYFKSLQQVCHMYHNNRHNYTDYLH
jgi:E3 ubiquitin-protein ligase HUWE1